MFKHTFRSKELRFQHVERLMQSIKHDYCAERCKGDNVGDRKYLKNHENRLRIDFSYYRKSNFHVGQSSTVGQIM